MTDGDFLDDRRRASEDDYFRKKDRELIEKLRQAAEAERATSELRSKTGLSDPELLKSLQDLSFTPETIAVLPLVPIVQIAWAEGGVSQAERDLIVKFARERGIAAGTPADTLLNDWMTHKPSDAVFAHAARLVRAMLDAGGASGGGASWSADELIKYAENIAAASGGLFGLGKVSSEERDTLAKITAALKHKA
jgi:DNA-binding phage protein